MLVASVFERLDNIGNPVRSNKKIRAIMSGGARQESYMPANFKQFFVISRTHRWGFRAQRIELKDNQSPFREVLMLRVTRNDESSFSN